MRATAGFRLIGACGRTSKQSKPYDREGAMITRRRLLKAAGIGTLISRRPRGCLQRKRGPGSSSTFRRHCPRARAWERPWTHCRARGRSFKLSYRLPNYETPIEYLRADSSPNDAFLVRYHLSDIPPVDARTWKLAISRAITECDDRGAAVVRRALSCTSMRHAVPGMKSAIYRPVADEVVCDCRNC
jgi:hypothetical protein